MKIELKENERIDDLEFKNNTKYKRFLLWNRFSIVIRFCKKYQKEFKSLGFGNWNGDNIYIIMWKDKFK